MGCMASEMESAALFIVGAYRRGGGGAGECAGGGGVRVRALECYEKQGRR